MITFRDIGKVGRFGNMLFQIASTIGIARRSGQPFCFPKVICYDMKERFGSTEDINVFEHLLNPLPEYQDLQYEQYPYFWGYRELNLQGNWNLNSHFQSEKYFKHCIDEVRHYLTFKDEPKNNDMVAVHYRAGDYENNPDAYHPRLTEEYYREAVKHFPEMTFFLFSDNLDEADKVFGSVVPDLEISDRLPGSNYLDDFKNMKHCKHFICANSSYSLMAAILADQPGKKIICPKKWFGDIAGLETADLYPEGAIIL